MTEQVTASHPPKAGRDWAAYNKAQTLEARFFDGLLWDLLQCVEEPPYIGTGRPPTPRRDALFCAIQKSHTGFSSRRNQGNVTEAVEDGFLRKAPHFNTASKVMNRPETEAILRRLVQLSAVPLSGIEHVFAVDSTAFRTRLLGSYAHTKHTEPVVPPSWYKLHVCIGTTTHVVTDCIVADQNDADSPRFESLVRETAKTFILDDVTADKAYSSKKNHQVVKDLGGQAIIPFKGGKSAAKGGERNGTHRGTPGSHGSAKTWRRAYHYFQMNPEEFYARYHKRSNVEAVFSAMKKRLGESLRAKNPTARKNEVYCKVVAYNIHMLVKAMMEGVPVEWMVLNPLDLHGGKTIDGGV